MSSTAQRPVVGSSVKWILNAGVISGEYVFRAAIDQLGIGISDASKQSAREPLVELGR